MHLLIEKTLKHAAEYFQNFFIHEYTRKSYLHEVHPAVKLAGTAVLILLSITTFDPKKLMLTIVAIMLLAFNTGLSLKELVKRSYLFTVFSFVIVLPVSISEQDFHYAVIFPLRVFSAILAIQMLIMTTKLNEIVYAMKRLKLPDMLSDTIWLTYRYTTVMFRDLLNIMLAREARRLTKSNHSEVLKRGGEMLGLYFLRSFEKAEKIEMAMRVRGKHVSFTKRYDPGYFYLAYLAGVSAWWLML
ncbi:cobalt ECF transporter T component CbiQ [Geoglobus acetivorans]|uniref:Transmembrane component NikQ of energizing module of nickel ECF transporter n=1 Tax=Geoglobus acetivorans TaxID=565033 RepID=A0A0A7GCT7_GEOAI|nr:Transmembrane component NikQ of energizing module of nickel ECF transporter [Geoglobus acetivorans]